MQNRIFRTILTVLVGLSVCHLAFAQKKAFDASRMDTSVSPCNDFFQYVNGTWVKNTQIPASESRWGSFNSLAEDNNTLLRQILEEDSKTKSKEGTDAQLIGDFYSACMDEASIEAAGTKPVEPFFKKIAVIKDQAGLQREIAAFHQSGMNFTVPSIAASCFVSCSSRAVPPTWNVRIVSCVPGSPIDWAAITPTASPISTVLPVARFRP